jgi:hypothetical protein
MRLRIPSWQNLFRYLQYDLHFRQKSKHIIQKCLADMGTGITDVIGGPHDFLPPRSDEFQKLCNTIVFTRREYLFNSIMFTMFGTY